MKLKKIATLPILIFLFLCHFLANAQTDSLLSEADKHFKEKSFAIALTEYKSALVAGTVPNRRKDEVAYRLVESLGRSGQLDIAVPETLSFIKTRKGTIWEARGLYWLGRLYLGVEHYGFRDGEKLTRGGAFPRTESDNRPRRIERSELDIQDAREAFEAAATLYTGKKFSESSPEEEMLLDFDLISLLERDIRINSWISKQRWNMEKEFDRKPDPRSAFATDWSVPKKLLYLFARIPSIAPATSNRSVAQALYLKAEWLETYGRQMSLLAYSKRNFQTNPAAQTAKIAVPPYPFQEFKPQEPLRELIARFPEDPLRDPAQLKLARLEQVQEHPQSYLNDLQKFIEMRPLSPWAVEAKKTINQIVAPNFNMQVPSTLPVEEKINVKINSWNIKMIRFSLYRLDLIAFLNKPHVGKEHRNDESNWTSLNNWSGKSIEFFNSLGTPLSEWDHAFEDRGEHQWTKSEFNIPKLKPGAYALVGRGGGRTTYNILIASAVSLISKMDHDHTLFFAVDARTGKPIAGAKILCRLGYYLNSDKYGHELVSGQTDESGLFTVIKKTVPGRTYNGVCGVVEHEGNFALTNPNYFQTNSAGEQGYKSYCTTDRAVYRPKQTVYYRNLVMHDPLLKMKPLKGELIYFSVSDSRGKSIHSSLKETSEFGSVNGEFVLPSDSPLGAYRISTLIGGAKGAPAFETSTVFRVEEYKKPEFEVTVTPNSERVKIGGVVSAIVKAAYYFGGPAPNAKISYRIRKNWYSQQYSFSRPYDYFYTRTADFQSVNYRAGDVVAQGTALTDAKGEAIISYDSKGDGVANYPYDLTYSIDADVRDSSRRTISGSGIVKATRHDIAVFMDFPHGYASQGDRVDIEIATRNSSDKPISTKGIAKVYQIEDWSKEKGEVVFERSLSTDKEGRAFLKWKASKAGLYRVAFTVNDSSGEKVESSRNIFVEGPGLANGRFNYQGVFMAVKELYYVEGDEAKLLIVTQEPDCDILLTREAGNRILDKKVIHIPGRSLELTLPISRQDSPNVFFTATMVKKGKVLQATQEVFVPPAHQLAKVEIKADRAKYEPGQKAKFSLKASDFLGRPLRTELAVSLSDASLNYIQKSYSPDISVYYYGERRRMNTQNSFSNYLYFGNFQYENGTYVPPPKIESLVGIGLISEWPGAAKITYPESYYGQVSNGGATVIISDERGGPGGHANPYAQEANNAVIHENDDASDSRGRPERDYKQGDAASRKSSDAGLRTKFADTAFWSPSVVTNAKGEATVETTLPDNLTLWRASCVGNTADAQVGSASTDIRTKKDLLVRLEAPRFFVERDQLTLSGIFHNSSDAPVTAEVSLALSGKTLDFEPSSNSKQIKSDVNVVRTVKIQIPAKGESRFDWQVSVVRPGNATIRLSARAANLKDATELSFPVLLHGIERSVTTGGTLVKERAASVEIDLPEARMKRTSEVVIHLTPSIASVMLDALPYVIQYPYDSIENTMSRFLPAALTASVLKQQGIRLEDLRDKMQVLYRESKKGRRSLNINYSPYSYSNLKPGAVNFTKEPLASPVYSEQELKSTIDSGLLQVASEQNGDGGWGWWRGNQSDPYMSAYVLQGLQLAKMAGHPIGEEVVNRGLNFLMNRFMSEKDLHLRSYYIRALAMFPEVRGYVLQEAVAGLFEKRELLNAYTKALIGLALFSLGDVEKANTILRNLENTMISDIEDGSAHWESSNTMRRQWYCNQIETNATILQAIVTIRPDSKIAPMLVKWLVNHRHDSHWNSTLETATTICAFSDYLKVTKELSPNYTLTVSLGDKMKEVFKLTPENALLFDHRLVIPDSLLTSGKQTISITKEGEGSCYFTATTRYFSQEEPIKASANEIAIERRYFKLIAGTASAEPLPALLDLFRPNPFLTGKTSLLDAGERNMERGYAEESPNYERISLKEGDVVSSGDLLEVELQIESKNDCEYLVFEDIKPAGCELVEVRSETYSRADPGYYEYFDTMPHYAGFKLYAKKELRDQKTAFFIDTLPQGRRLLSYRLRAEAPGRFHVLPTNGYALYAPDVRANSDEARIIVKDE